MSCHIHEFPTTSDPPCTPLISINYIYCFHIERKCMFYIILLLLFIVWNYLLFFFSIIYMYSYNNSKAARFWQFYTASTRF